MSKLDGPTVFYDGACPLCRREIAFYRRRKGADRVCWVDVSGDAEGPVAPGLSREQARARFHVLEADGRLVSGGRAFASLWGSLAGLRLLAPVFRTRPFAWLLDWAYDGFLRFRPYLQSRAVARRIGLSRPSE